MFISHYNGHGIKLVRPLSTVDNTRDYARVPHSRQWSKYNFLNVHYSNDLDFQWTKEFCLASHPVPAVGRWPGVSGALGYLYRSRKCRFTNCYLSGAGRTPCPAILFLVSAAHNARSQLCRLVIYAWCGCRNAGGYVGFRRSFAVGLTQASKKHTNRCWLYRNCFAKTTWNSYTDSVTRRK